MCSFQSTDKKELINHISKHATKDETICVLLNKCKCRNCGEFFFENKWSLMEHRKENHEMPLCCYDTEGLCS